jgi:23S rRNA (cytidine1920-2'-O)/16S rRNA (cytidine1409-2'-O)-methyltransferase
VTTDRPPGDEPPASAGQAGSADEPTRADEGPRFISRAGPKLHHAIRAFGLDPGGAHCVDFGCSTGGFTHAWLHHGAASVIAVDTGYGVLDYRLRGDERVRVLERTNAMHADPPAELVAAGGARFVSVDVSWTPQHLVLLNAVRWLDANDRRARIVSLVKPHYEASSKRRRDRFQKMLERGALAESDARAVLDDVLRIDLAPLGLSCLAVTRSPIVGGKSGKRKRRSGRASQAADHCGRIAPPTANTEYLVLLSLARAGRRG